MKIILDNQFILFVYLISYNYEYTQHTWNFPYMHITLHIEHI